MSHCSEMAELDGRKKRKKSSSKKPNKCTKESNILPPPNHAHGYTDIYLELCLIVLGVDMDKFWKAFGVNTCMYDEKEKCNVYYKCDIESALSLMGYGTKYHGWD